MTDLISDRRESPAAEAARAAASAAARGAGVDIRPLDSVGELEAVRRLYERIWRTGENNPPVTADLLRAMWKAGSYVSGAFDGGEMVGACFGFFSPPARATLHSHIAGVLARTQGRNVGFALKLHQRAWAMPRGVGEVAWTYDPLIRRNAYFNITKLAADPAEYLPNFYGPMDDDINRSDDTDRVLVRWRLESPEVEAACAGRPRPVGVTAAHMGVALGVAPSGGPLSGRADAPTVLVGVPADIETMREKDPARAAEWRKALREVLGGLLAEGARVRGFDRAGWYIVDRQEKP
ncbi:GNAT family N-acetyltransferase [Nonomuraea sp. NPDC050547]|uniref:GNAT family N-acetyltransferase n=1 Tax=Nonomuraea sp. NPDC050547 TaxID=3364368 RepID=UPI00378EB566